MSRGLLATFSGVDAAGKTTQLKLLQHALCARGLHVETLWYRPGYSKLLDALRARIRRTAPSALPSAGPSEARTATFKRPGVTEAWLALAHADMFAQYAIQVRRHLRAGTIVLCDRYLDDSELDLQLRFPDRARALSRSLSAMRTLCPRPDLALLFMVPWDVMVQRQAAKNEPFPDVEEARRARFGAYQQLASSGRYYVVDAARTIEAVAAEVYRAVDRVAAQRGKR